MAHSCGVIGYPSLVPRLSIIRELWKAWVRGYGDLSFISLRLYILLENATFDFVLQNFTPFDDVEVVPMM